MSVTTVPNDVEQYLAAVRDELADLPTAERDDLLAEVEASLLDSVEDAGGPITARLGPPADFAAELRAAAGLHEPAKRPDPLRSRAARFAEWAVASPRARAARSLARELAPIWWFIRGYVAVALVALLLGTSWSTFFPFVPRIVGARGGLLAILAAIVVSIALGMRARRRGTRFPRLLAAVNVALVVACLPVAAQVTDTSSRDVLIAAAYAPAPTLPDGLVNNGVQIDNVYPYSRDGRLLHDVLLYDGAGVPLEIDRGPDPNRRVLTATDGTPIFNAFPIRYFEPGTGVVAEPDAAPPIDLPEISPPPVMWSAQPR